MSVTPICSLRAASSRALLTLLSLLGSLACAPAGAQGQSAEVSGEHAAGRLLLMPRAGLPDAVMKRLLRDAGARGARALGRQGLQLVDVPPGAEAAVLRRLARQPHFKFVELDRRVEPAMAANDPYFGSQWHLGKIGAPTAWETSAGNGITIAILDTGVDGAHADLASRMVAGWNFHDNNANTADVHGHGTAVAGSAAATLNNATGVAAIAGQARIMPVRIADANAYAYWSTVAQGLTWAADNGARVANISYVGVAASSTVRSAAQYFKDKGGLVLVSAGNNNKDEGISATTTMIPVSATDESDQKTSFSSWGNFVAMAAPGINVWTTQRGGSYGAWWGTSIASPVTAGVVAAMMSRNPSLSNLQIEDLLYTTAADLGAGGRDPVFGHGRVDAAAAVVAAGGAVVPPADTELPTGAISSPAAAGTVAGVVAVDVNVADNVGVTRVDLLVNGVKVAGDTSVPFGFSWDTTKAVNGEASLGLEVFDAAGNRGRSAWVRVNVANVAAVDTTPPVVTLGNPVDGATVSGTVAIKSTASDDSGSAGLSQTLWIDGKKVASASGGTLSYKWNTKRVATGMHTIEVRAADAAGNAASWAVSVKR
jgi:hypothetical protein